MTKLIRVGYLPGPNQGATINRVDSDQLYSIEGAW
jgi:hypothetical protein